MHFWGFGVPGLCSGTGRLQDLASTLPRHAIPAAIYRTAQGLGLESAPHVFLSDVSLDRAMDAEGLGRELLLTPSGDPRKAPENQTVGIVTASQKC